MSRLTGGIDAKVSFILSSTSCRQTNSPTASGSVMRDFVSRCPRFSPRAVMVNVVYPSRYIRSRRLWFPHTSVKSRWRSDSNSMLHPQHLTFQRAPSAKPRSIDGILVTAPESLPCEVTRAWVRQKQAPDGQGRASKTKLLKASAILRYADAFSVT